MPPTRFIRTALRSWLGRLGYEIYRRPHLPKGADAFESIRSHWPEWRPALILDVGANVGQSHARLRPLFPAARLICFEPVPVSFARLEQAIASDPLASAYPLALSDTTGPAWIHAHGSSDQSSMVPAILAAATRPEERIPIQTDTLAAFCTCASVSHIDLLKIDVEGHEMAVLAGAAPPSGHPFDRLYRGRGGADARQSALYTPLRPYRPTGAGRLLARGDLRTIRLPLSTGR